jgi:hypothetical protein
MKYLFLMIWLLTSSLLNAQQYVGIGTASPSEKLEVNGNIKADTIKPNAIKFAAFPGTNKVLVSDVNGNASWKLLETFMLPFNRTQPTDGAPLFTIHNNNATGGTTMNILANYSSSATAIRGESTTGRASFFTSTSGRALETSGDIKLTGIEESNRAVLTSDANGNATWNSRMFFKANGVIDFLTLEGDVDHVLTDWTTISLNKNGNSPVAGGFFDNANGKYFVFKAGIYRISIRIHLTTSGTVETDYYNLSIRKNGSTSLARERSRMQNAYNSIALTTIVELAANDYIQFIFRHTKNGNIYLSNSSTSPFDHEFIIEKVD